MDFERRQRKPDKENPEHINALLTLISAGLTEFITYPLESLKVRMQMQGSFNNQHTYTSSIDCLRKAFENNGLKGIYKGLQISLVRESTFHFVKFLSYDQVKIFFLANVEGSGIYRRLLSAYTAAALSIIMCTPLDLAKIKYVSEPKGSNYKSSAEIFKASFQGNNRMLKYGPCINLNLLRQFIFMGSEFAARDQTRQFLIRKKNASKDSIGVTITSGLAGSLLASLIASPVDFIRTRFYSQIGEGEGQVVSKSTRMFVYAIKNEGILTMFRGIGPFMMKNVAFSTIFYVIYESLKNSEYVTKSFVPQSKKIEV